MQSERNILDVSLSSENKLLVISNINNHKLAAQTQKNSETQNLYETIQNVTILL